MYIIRYIKAQLNYINAVRTADEQHSKTGERYFVLPEKKGKLWVTDKRTFRKLKAKGYFKKSLKVKDLYGGCFYATPGRLGNDGMPDNLQKMYKKLYIQWATKK